MQSIQAVWVILFVIIFLFLFVPFIQNEKNKRESTQIFDFNSLFKTKKISLSKDSDSRKLSIERIKSDKAFTNISDAEAQEIADGLFNLSILTYNIYKNGAGRF